jgi:DNA-binding NarL/FixJ family response regulator
MSVVLVDDYEPWRRFERVTLSAQEDFQVVGEASDGAAAVQKVQELQPNVILLDIGLPGLNGIIAARQIGQIAPHSKILFVSENSSLDIAKEALSTGAGFVTKSDAALELLPAIKAVLDGRRFISASLAGHFLVFATLTVGSWLITLSS